MYFTLYKITSVAEIAAKTTTTETTLSHIRWVNDSNYATIISNNTTTFFYGNVTRVYD